MKASEHITPHAEMQISDARPEHEAAVRALSDATHRTHRARLPHVFGPENSYQHWLLDRAFAQKPPPKSTFRNLLRVACQNDEVVGYAMLVWDTPQPPQTTTTAVVADIAVTPELQRTGIATALLADANALRETHGWHAINADVWDGNAASHALFVQAGFVAERTVYRRGTPPPLTEADASPPAKTSRPFWWIAAALLLAIAFVASVP